MGCGLGGICFKVAHLLSQSVPVCPSGRSKCWNPIFFFYLCEIFTFMLHAMSYKFVVF